MLLVIFCWRHMLKKDIHGKFIPRLEPVYETRNRALGFSQRVQTGTKTFWRFNSKGRITRGELEEQVYLDLLEEQKSSPVSVMNDSSTKRRWWMFRDEFYYEDEGFTEVEIRALILNGLAQKERKIKRAVERLEKAKTIVVNPLPPLPDLIPNHVKLPARQRDARIWRWKSIDEWGKEISHNGIESAAISRWYRFPEEIDEFYLYRLVPTEDEPGEPRSYAEVRNLLETEITKYPQLRALIHAKIALLKEAATNSVKYPICIPYVWNPSDDDTRSAWFFDKEIYVVEHPSRSRKYTDDQIRQLILEFANGRPNRRERIPESVRIEVWRRDGGMCARPGCGSREKLEYDHIIPLSKGGTNTARNIELLCEKHNREKSNHIE